MQGLTVLASLRTLRRNDVPIALVPPPALPAPPPENGFFPNLSFCVPCNVRR